VSVPAMADGVLSVVLPVGLGLASALYFALAASPRLWAYAWHRFPRLRQGSPAMNRAPAAARAPALVSFGGLFLVLLGLLILPVGHRDWIYSVAAVSLAAAVAARLWVEFRYRRDQAHDPP
jgi:hypothetical protein